MTTSTNALRLALIALVTLGVTDLAAQDGTGHTFDVKVETVQPDALPDETETKIPNFVPGSSSLPRPIRLSDLKAAVKVVRPNVVSVVAFDPPAKTFRTYREGLTRGWAVWVTPADGPPMLVTSNAWYPAESKLYIDPLYTAQASMKARRATLSSVTLGKKSEELRKRMDTLTQVTVASNDRHRGIARLEGADLTPPTGFVLRDVQSQSMDAIFGYDAETDQLVQTRFVEPGKDDLYYLQIAPGPPLGAPIVDSKGRLVSITSVRHLQKPDRTLVVPPLALKKFLELEAAQDKVDETASGG